MAQSFRPYNIPSTANYHYTKVEKALGGPDSQIWGLHIKCRNKTAAKSEVLKGLRQKLPNSGKYIEDGALPQFKNTAQPAYYASNPNYTPPYYSWQFTYKNRLNGYYVITSWEDFAFDTSPAKGKPANLTLFIQGNLRVAMYIARKVRTYGQLGNTPMVMTPAGKWSEVIPFEYAVPGYSMAAH